MSALPPSDDKSMRGSPGREKDLLRGSGLGRIIAVENRIQQACGIIGGGLLIVLLGLVFFSFLSRTFGWTTTFSEEFTRYTVTAIFSVAVGYTALQGKHVCTDSAVLSLSSKKRRAVAIVVQLINIATFAFFVHSAHSMWKLSFQWGMKSNTDIAFPLWIPQGLFYLSFFLLIIRALAELITDVFAWDTPADTGTHL